MTKNRTALLLTIAVALGGVFAGCGGDDSDAPTKEEFVAQADKICTESITYLGEQAKPFGNKPSDKQLMKFVRDTYLPELDSEVAELQALTAPEGDEATVEEMFGSFADGVAEINEDPTIVISGDSNPLADASQKAAAYGLKVCGTA